MMSTPHEDIASDFQVFVTAAEAWPALERAVLGSKVSFFAGFRIFDLSTKLRSREALDVGATWFDLLEHALRRGVQVSIVVSDFDPVMAVKLHELAWRTVRQGAALAETAEVGADQLRIAAHMHPAQAGFLPWLFFTPIVAARKAKLKAALDTIRVRRQAIGLRSSELPSLFPATHHQKVAVVDDELLYIGGLDLNERRYDTPEHDRPAKDTWSDVQILARGPEAKEARRHLDTFKASTDGRSPPPDCTSLRRTLSAPRRFQLPFLSPRTLLAEIEASHVKAFRTARQLIYIETQFFRSSVIADALAETAATNPDLTAVIVLPALPDNIAYEGKRGLDARFGIARRQSALRKIQDAFGSRLTLCVPVQPKMAPKESIECLSGSPLIHVHNKVLVTDNTYALIGSANLNGRSMRWDTEIALEITDLDRVARVRERLMRHWWFEPLPSEGKSHETLQPWWHREVARNGLRLPKNRSGFLVPFDGNKGADLAQDLPGVTENIV